VTRVSRRAFGVGLAALPLIAALPRLLAATPGLARHRAVISTDIGGTDPDDFQSMVHLLVSADSLDLEGLISSPFGPGRVEHIHEVIDLYERDFPNLRTHSDRYPTPDALRAICKQGAIPSAGYRGVDVATEGSDWLVQCARKPDARPLHVLVWGGIEDVAQALHDAPDILPRLRVYFIGGPNKKWSPDAYAYIAAHHPKLWMIECNSSYRGWFVGGDQSGNWSNTGFVSDKIVGRGALGDYFATKLHGTIKMGDTPSVAWLIGGNPAKPAAPGWGGQFVRAWDRAPSRFDRMTTAADRMELFGILELGVPIGSAHRDGAEAQLEVDNQKLIGHFDRNRVRFRFCPREEKVYRFKIRSTVGPLNGIEGGITVAAITLARARRVAREWPHWWTDDQNLALGKGELCGLETVNRWRREFLSDFAERMARCATPRA
jgi:hypothetical protein